MGSTREVIVEEKRGQTCAWFTSFPNHKLKSEKKYEFQECYGEAQIYHSGCLWWHLNLNRA